MQRYGNLTGNSGVTGYEIARDGIIIEFNDGDCYLYNYASTGRKNVETMKRLAETGRGLSTFVSQHVRDAYAAKL